MRYYFETVEEFHQMMQDCDGFTWLEPLQNIQRYYAFLYSEEAYTVDGVKILALLSGTDARNDRRIEIRGDMETIMAVAKELGLYPVKLTTINGQAALLLSGK